MTNKQTKTVTYRQEFRRCGKANCMRCSQEQGHGPYWYAYWRSDEGRLRSRYCGKERPLEADDGESDIERSPALRIRVLGAFEVFGGSLRLRPQDWSRSSAKRLLALLLVRPSGLTRDDAAETLWPDANPEQARHALNMALSALRAALDTVGANGVARLPRSRPYFRLRLSPADDVDLHRLSTVTHPERLALDDLREIVGLYRGDLFPEFVYEEWTLTPRETAQLRWQTLALHLSERLLQVGEGAAAVEYLQKLIAAVNTNEDAARLLMRILCENGERPRAIQVYTTLEHALQSDLGVDPDPATRRLLETAQHLYQPSFDGDVAAGTPLLSRTPASLPRDVQSAERLTLHLAAEASSLLARGEPDQALGAIDAARKAVRQFDLQHQEVRLLLSEAAIYDRLGQYNLSEYATHKALRLGKSLADDAVVPSALRLQSKTAQHRGDLEISLHLAEKSATLFEEIGNVDEALRGRRMLAHSLWASGRLTEALAAHTLNLESTRSLSDPEHKAYIICGLGSTHLLLGNVDAASSYLHDALSLANRLEDEYLRLCVEYHLANVWYERSFLSEQENASDREKIRAETDRRFQHVVELADRQRNKNMQIMAEADYAVALVRWGRPDEARRRIEDADEIAEAIPGAAAESAWLLLSKGELALRHGYLPEAMEHASGAMELLERCSPLGLSQAHRILAGALARDGNVAAAGGQWDASFNAAFRTGQRLEAAHTQMDLDVLRTSC